jgi:chromate transporter
MRPGLGELARAFAWLGLTAFGGPAAHIAIMQREFVERRAWLSRERFIDLIGLSSLLPGPSSTEVAMGIGYERGRWPGLILAGFGFILPATLIVLAIAVAYERVGSVTEARWLLYGMAPVVIAVILHALISLVPTALDDQATWLVGIGSFVASVGGLVLSIPLLQPLVVLLAGAVVLVAIRRAIPGASAGLLAVASGSAAATGTTVAAGAAGLGVLGIFLSFLKMGVVVFGSGYVLVAFLGSELVEPGYITQQELLDAIAIGQLTPGPVFTAATFIGYLMAGVPGALAATAGIFLPAFVLVGAVHPFIDRLRANPTLAAAMEGLNAAAIGLIGASVVALARDAFVDPLTITLGAAAFGLLLLGVAGPVRLLIAGAVVGLLANLPGL